MKTLAILIPVVWLIAAPIVAQQPPAPTAAGTARAGQSPATFKTKKLTRSEVDQLLAKPSQVLILDVRRPNELMTIGGFPVYLSIQVARHREQSGMDSERPDHCHGLKSRKPRWSSGRSADR